MTRRSTRTVLRTVAQAIAMAVASAVSSAAPTDRFLMLDNELRATVVTIAEVRPSAVRVVDHAGISTEVKLTEIAALAPDWWRPRTDEADLAHRDDAELTEMRRLAAMRSPGLLLLTDGQRLPGRIADETSADQVAWDHPKLGRRTVVFDDIRRMVLRTGEHGNAAASHANGAHDRVIMANGDVVTGFVESMGESMKMEADGRIVDLSLRQVAVIELSNPAKAPAGPRVWLDDGSVAGARELAPPANDGEIRLVTAGLTDTDAPIAVPLRDVVALAPSASRVVPMAALTIESQRSVGDRVFTEPVTLRWQGETLASTWRQDASPGDVAPPLDAADIELPGPMEVEWKLPAGASRIAGWAEVPTRARLWADFTLVFESISASGATAVLASESMSGSRPIAEFNIAFASPPPARIRVRIEPGPRGPIQTRVVLRRALLSIDAAAR